MALSANINFFGDDAEFDHVGIAVNSLDNSFSDIVNVADPIQNVKVAFININDFRVELVEPLGETSPVTKILERGQSLYHICFKVEDIQIAIRNARKHGFHCIAQPAPAIGFENKQIAWLFSRTFGLVELLEK